MIASPPPAALNQLMRWVQLSESLTTDSLELASSWQRQSTGANRQFVLLLALILSVAALLLLLQGGLLGQGAAVLLGGVLLLLEGGLAWRCRQWFWHARLEVGDQGFALSWRGPLAPKTQRMALADIVALQHSLHQGRMVGWTLQGQRGELVLPCSGRNEFDKLVYNLLKHLLAKRQPAIRFVERITN